MKSEVVFALEQAGWPAFLVDGAGAIGWANSSARRAFSAAFTGLPLRFATLWAQENTGTAEQFLARVTQSPVMAAPLKFRDKDGPLQDFQVAACPWIDGRDKCCLLQLLPATATPAAEKKAPDPSLAQKQKLDCALQMARTVALDFNNALTSILGHTSLVLSQIETNHPWRPSLLEVEKSAARAAEIAHDLGTFSLQEKETRGQSARNLNLVLQRTVEFFQSSREGNQSDAIEWKQLLERNLFAAKFDEAKIQQAFVKILENAREALPGQGRITVQTRNVELAERSQDRDVQLAAGTYVCAEVTDNGAGMTPEVLTRIFEPFFTTRHGRHRGLGLAWVYGIITNHGGGVAVSSQPGAGTSVRVYLPAEKQIIKGDGIPSGDLKGSQSILIVDDEEVLLTMGRAILSAYGYRVLTASNGAKALAILAADNAVDLVLTDLVMPVMSGRELIEEIHRVFPDMRILCMSGYIWPAGQGNEAAYLRKPFTSQELLAKVKQVLSE